MSDVIRAPQKTGSNWSITNGISVSGYIAPGKLLEEPVKNPNSCHGLFPSQTLENGVTLIQRIVWTGGQIGQKSNFGWIFGIEIKL